jgi:hypothetical protein
MGAVYPGCVAKRGDPGLYSPTPFGVKTKTLSLNPLPTLCATAEWPATRLDSFDPYENKAKCGCVRFGVWVSHTRNQGKRFERRADRGSVAGSAVRITS